MDERRNAKYELDVYLHEQWSDVVFYYHGHVISVNVGASDGREM
jgi:hypothetical protein